ALDGYEPVGRAFLVNGGHPVVAVAARPKLLQRILPAQEPTIQPEVRRGGDERAFSRAAADVFRILGERGLVAEAADGECSRQELVGLVIAPRALRRCEILAAAEIPRGRGHTVFGERARLVQTDDGRRAET